MQEREVRTTKKEQLKKHIAEKVIVTDTSSKRLGEEIDTKWLFDFRTIFLNPDLLDMIAEIFWDHFEQENNIQIGGSESAAIPLVTAIILKGKEKNKSVNGFYIRKSRKKVGLRKQIEGTVNDNKIILVDDLINKGLTFERQIKILEEAGKTVSTIFSLVRFRDIHNYTYLHSKNIPIVSFFTLADFNIKLLKDGPALVSGFEVKWYFKGKNPNYGHVRSKASLVIDNNNVYFGTDNGYFWSLNKNNGVVNWQFKTSWKPKGKHVFTTPVVYDGVIFFGTYSGNVYALDKDSGKIRWMYADPDKITSSPAIILKHNIFVTGVCYSLPGKMGGVVALDLHTGEKKWERSMETSVEGSSHYAQKTDSILVGDDSGTVYSLKGKNGDTRWSYKTDGPIKRSCALDDKEIFAYFGSLDGTVYKLAVKNGNCEGKFKVSEGVYATPFLYSTSVFVSSLDKTLSNFDVTSGVLNWSAETRGRIFAEPTVIQKRIFIGSNDGKLYVLDPRTGKEVDYFQTTERITNKVLYDQETDTYFITTFANEIYCLKKRST